MTSPDLILTRSRPSPFARFFRRVKEMLPPAGFWCGAGRGAAFWLLGGLALVLVFSFTALLWPAGPVRTLVGVLAALLAAAAAASLLALLLAGIGRLPFAYLAALAGCLLVTALLGVIGMVYLVAILTVAAALVLALTLLGSGLAMLRSEARPALRAPVAQHRRTWGVTFTAAGGILLLATLAWLAYPGAPLERTAPSAQPKPAVPALNLDDPSQPGSFAAASLCYGSPSARRAAPCLSQPEIATQPVDGSAFVEGWSGLRTSYWGFGPEAMPLNARVWYPQGEGPFPLVLIVHGNAPMEKPSDGGYDYLAELLASRGIIAASVDQNFLNLSFFSDIFILNGLEKENDARAWLLLEHLRLWHAWNEDPASPFYRKLDLERIALVGHSRGGEAAAVAAAFNRLPYYPDNARVEFDYGYGIRAVAAIAPVDGQYQPGGVGVPLQDVSYLALHGAHDMDVVSYMAVRQYERVGFSGESFHFKAGLYIDGANHGQFNTHWGRKDFGEPVARFFNLRQLMPPAQQRQIAQVYLSAFLEAALHDQHGYLELFRSAQAFSAWLPDGLYLNQYADSNTLLIGGFEEDIDLSTTSLAGGRLQGEGLSVWAEKMIPARWGSSANRAVYLGWESSQAESPASYTVELPSLLRTHRDSVLVFSAAGTREDPCPDEPCRNARQGSFEPPEFFDLTVEVNDRSGQSARLPLSSRAALYPPLETRLVKPPFRIVLPESEIVLQQVELPLVLFLAENPQLDPAALASVRLVFDRTAGGVIVLDKIGLRPE